MQYTCKRCGHQGFTCVEKEPDIFGVTIVEQKLTWHGYNLFIPVGTKVKKMSMQPLYWVEGLSKVLVGPDWDRATVKSQTFKSSKYGCLIHDAVHYGITVKAETVKEAL